MKKLIFITLSGLLFLMGCGTKDSALDNSNQRVDQQNNPNAINLSGKSTAEVLNLKYNRVVLKCALWSQNDKNINLVFSPNDTVTLDLKKNSEFPQSLELSAIVDNHEIKVSFEVVKLAHYGVLNFTDSLGNNILAQYSPYVEAKFSSFTKNFLGNGQFTSNQGSSSRTVKERIEDVALNQITEPTQQNAGIVSKSAFSDYVGCIIETDIKPEYRNQFVFKPAAKN